MRVQPIIKRLTYAARKRLLRELKEVVAEWLSDERQVQPAATDTIMLMWGVGREQAFREVLSLLESELHAEME